MAFLRSRGMRPFCSWTRFVIRIDAIWLATEPLDMRASTALICLQTVAPLVLKSWYMTGLAFGWLLAD